MFLQSRVDVGGVSRGCCNDWVPLLNKMWGLLRASPKHQPIRKTTATIEYFIGGQPLKCSVSFESLLLGSPHSYQPIFDQLQRASLIRCSLHIAS